MNEPKLLVFDSGLGGLTVLAALHRVLPGASYLYIADDAAFPYGDLADGDLIERCRAIMTKAVPAYRPDAAIIACNTASTLALPVLRSRFHLPFIGTVPAIKPAAEVTESGVVSVLATPGTVKRDYTRDLIQTYAGHIHVRLVGSAKLAGLAEKHIGGGQVDDAAISTEITPAFAEKDGKRTDTIVLGCTHFPLLRDRLETLAPWPVTWVDPAPAIARRVVTVLDGFAGPSIGPGQQPVKSGPKLTFWFTSGRDVDPSILATLTALRIRHLLA